MSQGTDRFAGAAFAISLMAAIFTGLAVIFTGLQWDEARKTRDEARKTREQQFNASLQFDVDGMQAQHGAGIDVRNLGPAIATVTSVTFYIDGKPLEDARDAFAQANLDPGREDGVELTRGDSMGPGDIWWLVHYPLRNHDEDNRARDLFENHLYIQVNYCAANGRCDVTCSLPGRCPGTARAAMPDPPDPPDPPTRMHDSLRIWEVLGTWASAAGTIGAVIVSLWLASRKIRPRLRIYAEKRKLIAPGADKGTESISPAEFAQLPDRLIVNMANSGEMPVRMTGVWWALKFPTWLHWVGVKHYSLSQNPPVTWRQLPVDLPPSQSADWALEYEYVVGNLVELVALSWLWPLRLWRLRVHAGTSVGISVSGPLGQTLKEDIRERVKKIRAERHRKAA